MMDDRMGWMGVFWLVALVALLLLIAAAYFAARAVLAGGRRELEAESARALLDRRLAAGEISPEEYHEREAALRSAGPASHRPRGRAAS